MPISSKNSKSNEELAVAIQSGETELTEVLWDQIQGLVKWKAERLMTTLEIQENSRGLEFDDLLQTGFIAMVEAVRTFRTEIGLFSPWFTYHLQNAFAELSGYRTKRKRSDPINTWDSLDAPLSYEPDADPRHTIIPDPSAEAALEAVENKIWHKQLHDTMEDILADLPEKSSNVLRRRFYENQTLAAVGNAYNVGIEMARQLELQALRELKKPWYARRLRPFLDFNFYSATGLGSFKSTGLSVQERYLIRKEARLPKHEADRQI